MHACICMHEQKAYSPSVVHACISGHGIWACMVTIANKIHQFYMIGFIRDCPK